MKKIKTNQTDVIGSISIILLGILFFLLISCAIFEKMSIVAPFCILVYAICAFMLIIRINTVVVKNRILRLLFSFIIVEAAQIVPYLIILFIKGLL